jgi:predicted NBD/HSP70 family sugar kinase
MMKANYIGVDLGGTKCALARFDAETFVKSENIVIPTRASDGFNAVIDDIVAAVNSLRDEDTKAIGIGVPGLVSKGVLLNAPNIKNARNIEVQKLLTEKLALPVFVGNDANCFALAEATLGAAQGKGIVIGITFGTGVGGGIIIDGKVFEGAHGYAAEIGHMLLMPGKPPYETDDNRGEVEQFLSGTAMGKRCEEANSPEDYLEGAVCSYMQPDIYREVAWLCTNLLYVLDPDMIVFGGSAGHSLARHVEEIEKELKKWLLPGTPLPVIASAQIKNAGVIGAALLCKE